MHQPGHSPSPSHAVVVHPMNFPQHQYQQQQPQQQYQQPPLYQPQQSYPPQQGYQQQVQQQPQPPQMQQQWFSMQQEPQFTYQPQVQQYQQAMPSLSTMPPPTFTYMPQPQQSQTLSSNSSPEEVNALWVGDLQSWMDENYIYNCFVQTGEVKSVKIIRNKQTRASEGYGFVEFISHAAAERVLQQYNGSLMPNTDQAFKLNWAAFGMSDRRTDGHGYSIFVGDLSSDVTDQLLQETFSAQYQSVKSAKVVIDTLTGRLKGYGFVRFGDEAERTRAMSEMNGVYCLNRPMRISVATPKRAMTDNLKAYGGASVSTSDDDPNNTTVFVGGLDPGVSDQELRQAFGQYGEIRSVKIPIGKCIGFVQFVERSSAEEAIQKANGTILGQQAVRLSWGRSPANKQGQVAGWAGDPMQVYYGYEQGYDGFTYGQPSQDGASYAYPIYSGYGSFSQQVT